MLGLSWLNDVFTGIWIIWDFMVIVGNMRVKMLLLPQFWVIWAERDEVGKTCSDLRSASLKMNIISITQQSPEQDPLHPKK